MGNGLNKGFPVPPLFSDLFPEILAGGDYMVVCMPLLSQGNNHAENKLFGNRIEISCAGKPPSMSIFALLHFVRQLLESEATCRFLQPRSSGYRHATDSSQWEAGGGNERTLFETGTVTTQRKTEPLANMG